MSPDAGDPLTGYLSLASQVSLRRLEEPCLYDRAADELYELNDDAMRFLERVDGVTAGLAAEADPEFLAVPAGGGAGRGRDRTRAPRAPRRGGQPAPSLRYLELYLTERCNLRCGHCFLGERRARRSAAGHPRDLSVAAALRLLDEFDAMGGLRLLLTGGEAMLHPGFWELNETSARARIPHGAALERHPPRRRRRPGLRVHEVQVSLDGLEGRTTCCAAGELRARRRGLRGGRGARVWTSASRPR